MELVPLINNLSFLIVMTLAHYILMRRFKVGSHFYELISGSIFGFIVVLGMLNPIPVASVVFDGRSIVLFTGSFFMGVYPAFIMGIISIVARIFIGGPGVLMGILIIVEVLIMGLTARFFLFKSIRVRTIYNPGGFCLRID
ncbi:MAG: LytS/YhcK type 5TM receptor domain-containing protein [Salinivirgaceae bacterium]|nr:LytS/YhcK type 5TM receptor domain-containing protein [Salinivirgaceae bacterium]